MNGFGFIEYKDAMDARDVVPAFHGSDFMGERLVVQFARGPRRNDNFAHQERAAPRPRRTPFRMQISGLPVETSWQVSFTPNIPRHMDVWKLCTLEALNNTLPTATTMAIYACLCFFLVNFSLVTLPLDTWSSTTRLYTHNFAVPIREPWATGSGLSLSSTIVLVTLASDSNSQLRF